MGVSIYIIRCADKSYYVGSTHKPVEQRVHEHQAGYVDGYTKSRRPVELMFSEYFENPLEAFTMERRIKGWTRKKKEALISRDFERLKYLSNYKPHGSTGSP